MAKIIHTRVTKIEVTTVDGSVMIIEGQGTLHVHDNQTKTDVPGKFINHRSAMLSMDVEKETAR